jgi:glycosyltransferase involved in cell wall biosynthesis
LRDIASVKEIGLLALNEITDEERSLAQRVLREKKVAVFVVAYNAERHLQTLISRIPSDLMPLFSEIFVIDDSSTDSTFEVATEIMRKYPDCNLNLYRTPFNRGYGGNQKLGYLYCIENKHDLVILLHGDNQYPPEYFPRLLAAFAKDEDLDLVIASRMLKKKQALAGGMPLYKWVGNQILTSYENRLLGLNLSEFHSGFRMYKVAALEKIPFAFNSDDFHFDTEIIIQAVAARWKIQEVAIPTRYADEKCHVNGTRYALNCAKAVLKYKLVNMGLFYQRNYDLGLFEIDNYQFKRSENSLHQYVLREGDFHPNMTTIELGANRGLLSEAIAEKVDRHIAVDVIEPDLATRCERMILDLDQSFSAKFPPQHFDRCVALDVVEHMNHPEAFLTEVFQLLKINGKLYISTANVCYILVRLSLLAGQFNYGKRGILDRTHKRLFSVSSFKRLISQYGFQVEVVRGFPPPLTDLVHPAWWMRAIEKVHAALSRTFPNVFAYNFLVVARRMDGISDIFHQTIHLKADVDQGVDSKSRVAATNKTNWIG